MGNYRILVKGIVRNADRFLLVKKWYDDRIFEPFQWEFVDGVAEFAELPDHAVQRVVQEKTRLSTEINSIEYTWGFNGGEYYSLGIAYTLLATSQEVFLSEDLSDYIWVTKDEIKNYVTNKRVLDDIEKAGLLSDFDITDLGKEGLFIEDLD